MKRQERRGADGDGDLSDASWTEEERAESAEQPVAPRQVRRALASPAQDDQLLFEQEILRDHRSHTTGATQLRRRDDQVKQGEEEVLHVRVSVGQTSGQAQPCPIRHFSVRIGDSRRTGTACRRADGIARPCRAAPRARRARQSRRSRAPRAVFALVMLECLTTSKVLVYSPT